MKTHGILFDFDGTLVDSLGKALASFEHALAEMGVEGAKRTPEEIKRYFGWGADRILIQILGSEERGLRAFEIFLAHQAEEASLGTLHEGVREALERLSAAGVPLGIVTGRHSRDLAIQLQPHGIAQHFSVLVADDHVSRSKPAPDGILLAAQKLGVDPTRTLYFGDTPTDLRAAHAAGATPVAVLWDKLAHAELMAQEKPAYTLRAAHEIWGCFEAAVRESARASRR